jgi:hypothetical protein
MIDTMLSYSTPAATEASALPLGGGELDALWFGGIERDRFRIGSRPPADLWISQCRPALVDGYRRQFDPRTAVASCQFRTETARVSQEAWVSGRARALIVRREADDLPTFLRLCSPGADASVARALGGLDLVLRTPETAVVALRVICDGLMTYVAGQLRLDMATSVILIVASECAEPGSVAYRDMDDRICELAVELVRPGGYAESRAGSKLD